MFANIFSYSVICLSILFMVSFAVQKLLKIKLNKISVLKGVYVLHSNVDILIHILSFATLPLLVSSNFIFTKLNLLRKDSEENSSLNARQHSTSQLFLC